METTGHPVLCPESA